MSISWEFREGEAIVPGRDAVALLGAGRRYETYLAWDEHLRSLVVVKIVLPEHVDDAATLHALAGEAALLDRLAHPQLLRSFGAELAGPRPHLVLEHIEGPRLSTLIRRYGLIVEQVLPLALNLCAALHYLSREHVVHFDVKPSNVIMGASPRLIDLSVARTFSELPAIEAPIGTDAYMAPEQCDPDRFGEVGPATDIWGLGATLYEALARRRPFPSNGSPFPQLEHPPAPLPDRVPRALADLVLPCLDPDPARRPAADELADNLEPLVDALPAPRIGRFRPGGKALEKSLESF